MNIDLSEYPCFSSRTITIDNGNIDRWPPHISRYQNASIFFNVGKRCLNDIKTQNAHGAITNLSLSIELYLKSILQFLNQNHEKTHDLQKLYSQLPIESQESINKDFIEISTLTINRRIEISELDNPSPRIIIKPFESVDILLEYIKNYFLRTRYMFDYDESVPFIFYECDILCFALVVKAFCFNSFIEELKILGLEKI